MSTASTESAKVAGRSPDRLPGQEVVLPESSKHIRAVRLWATAFVVGLILSGATAFPLQKETALVVRASASLHGRQLWPGLHAWLSRVASALADTNSHYPFLAYGTDWLAFGHLVIAVAFVGLFQDPIRNKWLVTFGLIACAGVVPLALVAGQIRGIPLYWRMIDCSFGVLGCIPLLLCRRHIHVAESQLQSCK